MPLIILSRGNRTYKVHKIDISPMYFRISQVNGKIRLYCKGPDGVCTGHIDKSELFASKSFSRPISMYQIEQSE